MDWSGGKSGRWLLKEAGPGHYTYSACAAWPPPPSPPCLACCRYTGEALLAAGSSVLDRLLSVAVAVWDKCGFDGRELEGG